MRSLMNAFKFLFILAALLAISHLNAADDADAEQLKFREECIKQQANLTPEEIQRIKDGKVVTKENKEASDNLQCYLQCIYVKNGIITADGKQNAEAVMKYMQRIIKDKAKMMPIMANCASQKSANPCATVYNFESCVVQQA